MIFNITSSEVVSKSLEVSTHFAIIKQGIYGLLGIMLGFVICYFGYHKFIQMSPFLLLGCVFFLALLFVPKIGQTINGARRWVNILGLTWQPSEFAKILIPSSFIYYVTKNKDALDIKKISKILLIFFMPIFLILIQPDTGTTAIIIVTLCMMLFLARIKLIYWILPVFLLSCIGTFVIYNMPHAVNRIKIYLHPELDLQGKGYQPYQAKIAVGSGKIFGKGLGESMQKLDYLPEVKNDYIAAIYAEETGFVGMIFLIALYVCVAYAGFSIAFNANDLKGLYLACMLTFLISFQSFLNLGVVSGLLPSKGVTLPFFSQGGTSLIANIAALFLLLDIAQKKTKKCQRQKY